MGTFQLDLTPFAVHLPSLISGLVRLGITILIIGLIVHFIFRAMSKGGKSRSRSGSSYAGRTTSARGENIAKWRDRWFGAIIGCQCYVILYLIIFLIIVHGARSGSVSEESAKGTLTIMNLILIPFGLLAMVFFVAFFYSKWGIGGVILGIVLLPLMAVPILNYIIFIALLWITDNDGEPQIRAGAGTFALLGIAATQFVMIGVVGATIGNQKRAATTRPNIAQRPSFTPQQAPRQQVPGMDISAMRESANAAVNRSIQANQSNPVKRANPARSNQKRTKPATANPFRHTTDYPQFAAIRDTLDSLEIALLPSIYKEKAVKFDRNGNGMLDNEDNEFGAFADANAKALLADRDAFFEKQRAENSLSTPRQSAAATETKPAAPAKKERVQPDFIDLAELQSLTIPQEIMNRVYDADLDHDGKLSINERTQGNLLDLVKFLPQPEPTEVEPDTVAVVTPDTPAAPEPASAPEPTQVAAPEPEAVTAPVQNATATNGDSDELAGRDDMSPTTTPLYDGSGRLNLAELRRRKKSNFFYEHYAKADSNGDDILTKEEMEVDATTRMRMGIREQTNDGCIDLSVLHNLFHPISDWEKKLLAGDKDGDGFLSQEEYDAAKWP
ncbi:MAG: hypothetical protein Q4G68_03760 [Planctomycetia bacterium]|nr:hypothetical protein [Planctomycetia bacterium]